MDGVDEAEGAAAELPGRVGRRARGTKEDVRKGILEEEYGAVAALGGVAGGGGEVEGEDGGLKEVVEVPIAREVLHDQPVRSHLEVDVNLGEALDDVVGKWPSLNALRQAVLQGDHSGPVLISVGLGDLGVSVAVLLFLICLRPLVLVWRRMVPDQVTPNIGDPLHACLFAFN